MFLFGTMPDGATIDQTARDGDMPINRKWGYLFGVGSTVNSRLLAHELGHGRLTLWHTFAEGYCGLDKKATTDNLMDYPSTTYPEGTYLNRFQWEAAHFPAPAGGMFQSDEDGAATEQDILLKICEQVLSNGSNGCAFVRKKKGTTGSGESVWDYTTIEYLAGAYTNNNIVINAIGDPNTDADLTVYREHIAQILGQSSQQEFIFYVAPDGQIGICLPQQDYSKYVPLASSANNAEFIGKFVVDYLNCYTNGLNSFMQSLQALARSNQQIQFSFNGKTYAYNGTTAETVTETDADINAGNWTDTNIDMKIRVAFNADGILQITALGIRGNLDLADGKTAILTDISNNMRQKGNMFFNKFQVKSIAQTPKTNNSQVDSEEFPGEQRVEIDKDTPFLKIVCEAGGIGLSFLKTATIEQPVYTESQTNPIKLPAIATGASEAAARVVTDITSMVSFGYDIIVDDAVRNETISGLKAIKDQVADDPNTIFPLFKDIALEELTGSTSADYDELISVDTDEGRRKHLGSRTTVRTVATVFASGKFLAKLPEMATEVAMKMARMKRLNKFSLTDLQDLVENFRKKIASLPDKGDQFLKDFENATNDQIRQFLEFPDLVDAWKRINDHLGEVGELVRKNPEALQKVDDAIKEGLDASDAIEDAAQTLNKSKPTWEEIKALFKRGNDFNRKARDVYDYNEIVLSNGKRLDTYIPGQRIISRKATDIDNIQESTWRNYCSELVTKYKVDTPVNSTKLPGEPPLSGKYYLEIPASNQTAQNLANFKTIAKTEFGIEDIIFLAE